MKIKLLKPELKWLDTDCSSLELLFSFFLRTISGILGFTETVVESVLYHTLCAVSIYSQDSSDWTRRSTHVFQYVDLQAFKGINRLSQGAAGL